MKKLCVMMALILAMQTMGTFHASRGDEAAFWNQESYIISEDSANESNLDLLLSNQEGRSDDDSESDPKDIEAHLSELDIADFLVEPSGNKIDDFSSLFDQKIEDGDVAYPDRMDMFQIGYEREQNEEPGGLESAGFERDADGDNNENVTFDVEDDKSDTAPDEMRMNDSAEEQMHLDTPDDDQKLCFQEYEDTDISSLRMIGIVNEPDSTADLCAETDELEYSESVQEISHDIDQSGVDVTETSVSADDAEDVTCINNRDGMILVFETTDNNHGTAENDEKDYYGQGKPMVDEEPLEGIYASL